MSEIDLVKQLVELSLSAGRSFQSPQTGYIHFCHQKGDEEGHQTIPTYENFLFALSLLRMKTAETVNEAKSLIHKLLQFQSSDGNFPTYLHTYPECRDRYHAVQLLPPIYWAVKEFTAVLGKELSEEIKKAVSAVVEHGLKQDVAHFPIRVKWGASLVALGDFYGQPSWKAEGLKILSALEKESEAEDFGTWYSPAYIGETMIALQMVPEISWPHFWRYVESTWDRRARTYVGPPVKVLQTGSEPQPTVYDLFLGEFTRGYPYHAFDVRIFQLQGALVRDFDGLPTTATYPMKLQGEVANHQFLTVQSENCSYSLIETKAAIPPELKKGFHPIRLVWGDQNGIHSMSVQGGAITSMNFAEVEGGLDLDFFLGEDPSFSARDKSHELMFYFDQHEGLDLTIDGQKATTFRLGEPVLVSSPQLKFTLTLNLVEGDGTFMGHIALGNRPAQTELKGENRFAAFDKTLFLRSVRRYTPCRVIAKIRFNP